MQIFFVLVLTTIIFKNFFVHLILKLIDNFLLFKFIFWEGTYFKSNQLIEIKLLVGLKKNSIMCQFLLLYLIHMKNAVIIFLFTSVVRNQVKIDDQVQLIYVYFQDYSIKIELDSCQNFELLKIHLAFCNYFPSKVAYIPMAINIKELYI